MPVERIIKYELRKYILSFIKASEDIQDWTTPLMNI